MPLSSTALQNPDLFMNISSRRFISLSRLFTILLLAGASALLVACGGADSGQEAYPSRPITYMVPWAAGGMTDMSSRLTAAVLQNKIGEPVNVVNRTGGGGVVGHLALSQARPDGYTIGAVTVEITMMHHMGLTPLTYQDYTPLALLLNNAAAVTVRADAPWNSVSELLAYVREHPGELQASGTARGGIWDLARMGFLQAAGLPESAMPWVPSQGAAPALQELLAGGVDVVTASLSEVDAVRQAGEVKVLGVMAEERLAEFPEVPTLKEQGIDWSIGGWVSVCGPASLPAPIEAKLDSAIQVAVEDPEFIASMRQAGNSVKVITGPALRDFMAEQDATNGRLLKAAGIAQ